MKEAVSRLSADQIERKAEEFIEYFDARVLDQPKPTPLLEFCMEIREQFGLKFGIDVDLGGSISGKKILGAFCPMPRSIYIDRSIVGTIRMPFVLAHEIGHYVLHRKLDPKSCGYSDAKIEDGDVDLMTGKKQLLSPRDWIEWQANRFAVALLMPRKTFQSALVLYQWEIGIRRNLGTVVLNGTNPSRVDHLRAITRLAEVYGVNRTNVEYRLNELGLVEDLAPRKSNQISAFFKSESRNGEKSGTASNLKCNGKGR